jgi:hypothetical protein
MLTGDAADLWYILDEHGEPKVERDGQVWSDWFQTDERRLLRQQEWHNEDGRKIGVSTVFLGMDHSFGEMPRPLLWETMAFVDGEGEEQIRWTSREAAIEGHNHLVAKLGGPVLEHAAKLTD